MRTRTAISRVAALAGALAGTVLLAAACGGSPGPAASSGESLYQRSLAYSRCMRSHGVPDYPILRQGPGGSLVHPLSPPAGMLSSPGYDAARPAPGNGRAQGRGDDRRGGPEV
jgi:hypothetical protein